MTEIGFSPPLLMRLTAHHRDSAAHSRRVADLCLRLYPDLEGDFWDAAACHDAGKLLIDAEILDGGALSPRQAEAIRQHPALGVSCLGGHPELARSICLYHHEWWDGSGYPTGRAGRAIPWEARLVSVADALDAMLSPRSYKPPIPLSEALRRLADGGGTQFDPLIAAYAVRHLAEERLRAG